MYFVTFLACPKKGDPKKGTRRPFLSVLLGRPRTFQNSPFEQMKHFGLRHPQGAGSLKCLTLGLGRMTGMFAWVDVNGFRV